MMFNSTAKKLQNPENSSKQPVLFESVGNDNSFNDEEIMVNGEAEQAILANLICDNLLFDSVADFLKPEHFGYRENGKIYHAIATFISKGKPADAITLRDYFKHDDELKQIGGIEYLASIASNIIAIGNTVEYGKLIKGLSMLRQLRHIAYETVENTRKNILDLSAEEQLEALEQKVYSLASTGVLERKISWLKDNDLYQILEEGVKTRSRFLGLITGYQELDEILGGLNGGDLIIIAGRPSMGKTAFAVNLAYSVAHRHLSDELHGGKTIIFSLEMSKDDLVQRIYAQESMISASLIKKWDINIKQLDQIKGVDDHIKQTPLGIDDTPNLTMSAIRTRARIAKRQEGIKLIIVDYLQLIQSEKKHGTREQEVSEMTRQLKQLARELDIPIIVLSQLTRGPDHREDKKPNLADLRESGAIEQDADVVMFVFREAYYLERKEPKPGTMEHADWQNDLNSVKDMTEIQIAKHRRGRIGTVKLRFKEECVRFENR